MQFASMPSFPNGSFHAGLYTLIFRIRHCRTQQILKEHSLVNMPMRMTVTTEARVALYYTQAGPVADIPQRGGVGATYFTLTGHTGYWGIRNDQRRPVADRVLGQFLPDDLVAVAETLFTSVIGGTSLPLATSLIDGAAAVKDLQDTLLGYFFPAGQPETREVTHPQDLQLEFLNLTAPTSSRDTTGRVGWIIVPHRNLVDIQQDASKPFLYNYTLQFAALAATDQEIPDRFVRELSDPQTGLRTTLQQLTTAVQSVTNGVNTIEDAFTHMVIQNVTGPVSTFLEETRRLGEAVGHFINGITTKLQFPLYAQRTLSHVLDAPRHSVTTLAAAAQELGRFLLVAADPRSLGRTLAGEALTGGTNDQLVLRLNHEPPVTLALGSQSSGTAIAAAMQSQVRGLTPAHGANASAYRDFTATFAGGQYTLASGTKGSNAGAVEVVVAPDPDLTPNDASVVLGLGIANGGHEQAGSAYPNIALGLLRGIEEACAHLQAFPDYFADQLEAQDAVLAALLPTGLTRPQIRGDQRLRQTIITPGDSLQGIAARVGTDWQTLALVNRLTYPYILEQPAELTRGRVSSAGVWTLTDVTRQWSVDAYAGQRVEILAGPGAGQSRRIVRNTLTDLVLEQAWTVAPNDTSDYAIRSAENPIVLTGTISAATAQTVTNGAVALVPDSQRGMTLLVTSGPTAGERHRVMAHDATTYTLETPFVVIPPAGSLYLLLGPEPATRRQKLVGETLSVPQPSAQALSPIRTRLQDVSAITGQHLSQEEKLFGRDALLDSLTLSLVYDPARADVVTLAGLPNLRQAVIHLVNIPIGELEYQPGLGSYIQEELGLTATLPLQIQLLASVERTIKQDGRIAAMQGAQLVTQGGLAVIVFGARAVDGSTVDRVVIR